jgi:hypothetical protein
VLLKRTRLRVVAETVVLAITCGLTVVTALPCLMVEAIAVGLAIVAVTPTLRIVTLTVGPAIVSITPKPIVAAIVIGAAIVISTSEAVITAIVATASEAVITAIVTTASEAVIAAIIVVQAALAVVPALHPALLIAAETPVCAGMPVVPVRAGLSVIVPTAFAIAGLPRTGAVPNALRRSRAWLRVVRRSRIGVAGIAVVVRRILRGRGRATGVRSLFSSVLLLSRAVDHIAGALGQRGKRQRGECGGYNQSTVKFHVVLLGLLTYLIRFRQLVRNRQGQLSAMGCA